MRLDPIQIRILGALIEKEIATPENYPLSLNALLAACNQRSSRDPVLDLAEDEVLQSLHSLQDMELTAVVRDSRVPKYEHRVRTVLNLRRDETAILCLLFLRGPQTPGELRARADRLYSFDGLEAVKSTLARLASSSATSDDASDSGGLRPLVTALPRQPGSREARFAHLLGDPIETAGAGSNSETHAARRASSMDRSSTPDSERIPGNALADRISALEAEIASLRAAIQSVEARLSAATQPAEQRQAE